LATKTSVVNEYRERETHTHSQAPAIVTEK
jgi:hypothetical protein